MSTRTERLQASNLYKVVLIGLAVVLGACLWMLVEGCLLYTSPSPRD